VCKIFIKNSQPFGNKNSENLRGVKLFDSHCTVGLDISMVGHTVTHSQVRPVRCFATQVLRHGACVFIRNLRFVLYYVVVVICACCL